MSEIHMVCGYMGFGKTTLAKRLAKRLPAVRLTHDEFMRDLFGRNLPDAEFRKYMRPVADLMWKLCGEICRAGGNAVMEWGSGRKKTGVWHMLRRPNWPSGCSLTLSNVIWLRQRGVFWPARKTMLRLWLSTKPVLTSLSAVLKFRKAEKACRWFFTKAAREGPSAGALGKLRPDCGFYQSVDIRGKRLSGRAVDMPVKIKVV